MDPSTPKRLDQGRPIYVLLLFESYGRAIATRMTLHVNNELRSEPNA